MGRGPLEEKLCSRGEKKKLRVLDDETESPFIKKRRRKEKREEKERKRGKDVIRRKGFIPRAAIAQEGGG